MTHPELVKALAKPGQKILTEMSEGQAHMLHMAIGICGEAGELMDAIKKWGIYQKPLDIGNVIEELGDLEFYMEGIRQYIMTTRDACLAQNIEKLTLRYGKTYSDKAAQERADKK